VELCLQAYARLGYHEALLAKAATYLDPNNKFNDIIRLAVVKALPSSWPQFNLEVFRVLRLALVDDSEAVRQLALSKAQHVLGTSGLSLSSALEALHRHARRLFFLDYFSWRSSLALPIPAAKDEDGTLFTPEPYNIFASPTWELSIN